MHPDCRDLFAELEAAEVRFTLKGAEADWTVLVSGSVENLTRLAKALETFGCPKNIVEHAQHLGANGLRLADDDIVYLGDPPASVIFQIDSNRL